MNSEVNRVKQIKIGINDCYLPVKVILADNFFTRLRGLTGRTSLNLDEGLLLRPCNGVHTYFMKFAIDVIYISRDGKILKIVEGLKPNKISKGFKNTHQILELSEGAAAKLGLKIKDRILF